MHIKRGERGKAPGTGNGHSGATHSLACDWEVKDLTDKILDKQPTNEKALYRRAQAGTALRLCCFGGAGPSGEAFFAFSLWEKCEADLDACSPVHRLKLVG